MNIDRSSAGELRERRLYGNLLSLDNAMIIHHLQCIVNTFLKKSAKKIDGTKTVNLFL